MFGAAGGWAADDSLELVLFGFRLLLVSFGLCWLLASGFAARASLELVEVSSGGGPGGASAVRIRASGESDEGGGGFAADVDD